MEHGYSSEYGARHLIRALERYVNNPLSDAINAGTVRPGCSVVGRRRGSMPTRPGLRHRRGRCEPDPDAATRDQDQD